jgi:hypothetical protein
MPFSVTSKKSGKTYHLHARKQELKGGQQVMLYYFAGEAGPAAIDALPDGYEGLRELQDRAPATERSASKSAPRTAFLAALDANPRPPFSFRGKALAESETTPLPLLILRS